MLTYYEGVKIMTSVEGRVIMRDIGELHPNPGNPRKHNSKQIRAIEKSIRRFGFVNPILIGPNAEVVCGHGRLEAARNIGMAAVPTLCMAHLSADELRAYAPVRQRRSVGRYSIVKRA